MVWMGVGVSALALAGIWFAPRLSRLLFIETSVNADLPCAFGYKMAWLAVRTRDTARLIEALRLNDARSANWSVGIGTIYNERLGLNRVFVTPPVNGWSFVAGLSLPHPVGEAYEDKCLPLLGELSREFGEVQYYISYPELDFYGWARLNNGRLIRAFASGREGVVWNKGAVTLDERSLGLQLFDLREVPRGDGGGRQEWWPPLREAHVLGLARCWSLDPTTLGRRDDLEAGTGYAATAPLAWQAAAMEQAA